MKYILASNSPRRKELLRLVIPDYTCIAADVEENCPDDLPVENRPEYLALKKAEFVFKDNSDGVVIGADTAVFLDGVMLGKPSGEADAERMLKTLSGRTHKVITGCAIVSKSGTVSFSTASEVTFYDLSDKEIKDYALTKEPLDKAGAYGIQGKGALLVREIKGDYFNIVGLPVAELKRQIDKINDDNGH